MLSRADSINSVVLIEEYAARLADDQIGKQLNALFLIKQEIFSILQKTKEPNIGIIRLKWWHDEVIKSRNNGFAPLDIEFELIKDYLAIVSEEDLKVIAEWIASYEPMVARRELSDLLVEYLMPVAHSYQKILKEIFNCEIMLKTPMMMAINDFLDYLQFFTNYGWKYFASDEEFNKQLSLVWDELDKISKLEKEMKIDNKIKFLFQSHDFLISKYRKYTKWEIGKIPKLNLGIMRMSLAMLALNK